MFGVKGKGMGLGLQGMPMAPKSTGVHGVREGSKEATGIKGGGAWQLTDGCGRDPSEAQNKT